MRPAPVEHVSRVGILGSTLESISVAKTLAAKRRQKVRSNQELIALGAANIAAGMTGGYPVTGGFSRSAVNFSAGASTGLASLIAAGLIVVSVLFLMPLFRHLPQAVLASIMSSRLQEAGVELYLTEVKGQVMDRLVETELFKQLSPGRLFSSTEELYERLAR